MAKVKPYEEGTEEIVKPVGRFDEHIDRFISLYVDRPCTCYWSCLCFMAVLSLISLATGCMTMHMEVQGAWSVMDAEMTQQYVMYTRAVDMRDKVNAEPPLDNTTLLTKGVGAYFTLNYRSGDGGNMFTPANLKDMCRFEKEIFTHKLYKDYCRRTESGDCNPFVMSPLQFFYNVPAGQVIGQGYFRGNLSAYDFACETLDATFVSDQVTAMIADIRTNEGKSQFAFYVDKEALTLGLTPSTRSMLSLGYPSQKAVDEYVKVIANGEKPKEADDKAQEAFEEEVQPTVDDCEANLFKVPEEEMKYGAGGIGKSAYQVDDDQFTQVGGIRVRFNVPWRNDFIMIQGDFIFAFGSIIFVFCYMYFHLASSFMATTGMLQIICSLPIAGLFYQGLFQVKFFQFLHVLTIFLVLGIGADDIFVLTDTWRGTAYMVRPTGPDGTYTREELKKRMDIAWRRTAQAIFNTSFTTAMAFASCSGSRVMPMRTNGWYAALSVVANYVLTVTLTPATLMIHHNRLEAKRCCCPSWSVRTTGARVGCCGAPQAVDESGSPQVSLVERVLDKYYLPVMLHKVGPVKIVPVVIAFILTVVGIQGTIFASQLTAPLEEENWFSDNHMHTYYFSFIRDSYYGVDTDNQAIITLYWGITDIDRSDFYSYEPWENPGEPVFDAKFDLSQPVAQNAILDTCAALRVLPCSLEGCRAASSYGGTLALGLNGSVACPLEDFGAWMAAQRKKQNPNMAEDKTLPTGQEFFTEFKEFRKDHRPSAEQKEYGTADWDEQIGFVNGVLKYFSVKARVSMPNREPFGSGGKVRDMITDWVAERRAASPPSAPGPLFSNGQFMWYDITEELINGLFQGCGIAGPIAYCVLIFATQNIVLATYAVLCVAGVVLSVLGFCKSAMGYSLGIGESIAGVIVIGLAVDYVVHLAHMYVEADHYGHKTREDRATFAIKNMGVTVFAGAITTCGAGLIMLFCFSTFFHKMAILMSMTIFYAFLFSLGLFMSLLFLIGPEHDFGDLKVCFRKCMPKKQAETKMQDLSPT